MVGLAEGVAAAVRRRQREREPRIVLYDELGSSRLVAPSAPGYDGLLDAAERMVSQAGVRLSARARSDAAVRDAADLDEPVP